MGKLIRVPFISVVMVLVLYACVGLNLQEGNIIFKDENDTSSEAPGCNTPDGSGVECVDIRTCLPLLAMVGSRAKHEMIKQLKCGWTESIPMVCCDRNWNCTTPNNDPGYCIPSTSCSDIVTEFPNSQETRKLKNSCGSNEFDVCCTSLTPKVKYIYIPATTAKSKEVDNCAMTDEPPDPGSECCGRDAGSNRILGGEITEIDEYPWLAALQYAGEAGITVNCGGTLISGTYVVTAAHCVFKKEPINVRLGDYDIDHPGEDCAVVDGGGVDCTDEAVIIPIEKIITHPEYNRQSKNQKQVNDIALLKLQDTAPYTDFIRPICLPTSDVTDIPYTIDLKVAGWGVFDEIRSYSPVKRHAVVPSVSREECFDVYIRQNISLGEGQICAGGVQGTDSCKGDSGGPLMRLKRLKTEIVGIISFGFTPCGLENKPAVYTNINYYLPWIRSIIN